MSLPQLFHMADLKVADRVAQDWYKKQTFKRHLLHMSFHFDCPLCVMQEEHVQHWLETHKAY